MEIRDVILTQRAPLTGSAALLRLTDDTGMLQHSRFGVPDRAHGYCIDDNARALLLMVWARDLPPEENIRLATIYAAFVEQAWNAGSRTFRNFMGYDRRWLEDCGSPDSVGRTYWALCNAAADYADPGIALWAATLRDQANIDLSGEVHLRAIAFTVLGACSALRGNHASPSARSLVELGATLLHDRIQTIATETWPWFEPHLSYDNARLCEALIRAGTIMGDVSKIEVGIAALRWLNSKQSTGAGYFSPVGTSAFGRPFAEHAPYDQQPLEAWAAIDACIVAQQACPDPEWLRVGEQAFAWFVGNNVLGATLANQQTGECFDGIGEFNVNLNRGAESVLAWQCARRRIETLRQIAQE